MAPSGPGNCRSLGVDVSLGHDHCRVTELVSGHVKPFFPLRREGVPLLRETGAEGDRPDPHPPARRFAILDREVLEGWMVMVDERGGTPIEPEREGLEEGLEALREVEQTEINPDPIYRSGIEEGLNDPIPMPDPAMDPDPVMVEGAAEVGSLPFPLPDPGVEDLEEATGLGGAIPIPIPGSLEGGEAEFKFFTPEPPGKWTGPSVGPEVEPEFTVEALDEGSLPIPTPEPALDDLPGEALEPDLDV